MITRFFCHFLSYLLFLLGIVLFWFVVLKDERCNELFGLTWPFWPLKWWSTYISFPSTHKIKENETFTSQFHMKHSRCVAVIEHSNNFLNSFSVTIDIFMCFDFFNQSLCKHSNKWTLLFSVTTFVTSKFYKPICGKEKNIAS